MSFVLIDPMHEQRIIFVYMKTVPFDSPTYKRADSPEQKDDRRKMILKAAAAELDRMGSIDDFTIDSLARQLDLSRGTIYLYFPDKYAIFLELLMETSHEFLEEIASRFSALPTSLSSQEMAKTFCDIFKADKQAASLRHLPQLFKSLAKNPDAKAKHFEKEIEFWRDRADKMIIAKQSRLKPGDGRSIIHYGFMLLIGLTEIHGASSKKTIPSEILNQVQDGLILVIDGLLVRARRGKE